MAYWKINAIRGLWLAVVCWLAVAPSGPAQNLSDNAALAYWKAAAVTLLPSTDNQIKLMEQIDGELSELPPRVLSVQPDALRWLLSEQRMLAALAEGARQAPCAFNIYEGMKPAPDVTHLPVLRDLTRQTLVVAKAYEYVDNPEGAGQIYANLLKLVQHLDQDRTLYSCAAAQELLQTILRGLEGFVSRSPSAAAFTALSRLFRDAPENILHPAEALEEERIRYTEWLLEDPALVINRLSQLYSDAKTQPAAARLVTLDEEDQQRRLRLWLDEYRYWIADAAAAFELPYREGIVQLQEMDRAREAMRKDPTGGDNPLIPLLVPPDLAKLYQRLLLAEAQFDMAEILCLAGQFRSQTGVWPERLADIQPLGYRVIPIDPFSTRPFFYKLSHGLPVIITKIPRWMTREGYVYELDLYTRQRHDKSIADRAIDLYREENKNATAQPVPME